MKIAAIKDINEYVGSSINPLSTPDTVYELYSVPSYENSYPEIIKGSDIGSSKVTVEENDILICKINPRINRVWVVKHNTENPLIASSEWVIVRSKSNDSDYLKYYFQSPVFRNYINSELTGIGGSLTRAQPKSIAKYPVPLPPLETQHQIAANLDKVTHTIDLCNAILEKLDLLVKSRFVGMFGDPVSDSKQWGQKPLSDMLESIRYGTSTPPEFSSNGYAFIRATNIKNGKIIDKDMKYISQKEAEKLEKCKLSGGEIIIVRSGVNAGDTCVITEKYRNQYAGYDMILVLNDKLNPIFLNELINTAYMEKIVKPLTRRAAQPHLNSEQTKSFPIICVPIELQNNFAAFVEQTDKSKSAVKKLLEKAETLKKALMQEYFG